MTSSTSFVAVTNNGLTAVTISAVSVTPSQFILSAGGVGTIKPGATTSYGLKFAPDSTTTFNGSLTLTVSGGSPIVVPLTGNGVLTLSVTPSSKNFGTVAVGLSTNDVVFTVTNIGTKGVIIQSVTTSPSEFVLTSNPTTGLQPSASAQYKIRFAPDAAQVFNGAFTVTLQKDTIPTVVSLTGTGTTTSAAVQITPNSLNFANVQQGTQSPSQIITITNLGAAPVNVLAPYVTAPFTVTGFSPTTLNPSQSVTMTVRMFGSSVGSTTGTINTTYNVLPPVGVSLTGNTIANAAVAVTTFSTLPASTQGSPYLATLQATGGTPPYSWRLATGATLPLGLTLSSSGTITGTPDASLTLGNYAFSVKATDSSSVRVTAGTRLTLPVAGQTGANCNDIVFNVAGTSNPLVPLTDLETGAYLGVEGGLYPNGSNVRPPDHDAAGITLADSIQPLDVNGNPLASGQYALLSLGESDTQQIYMQFMQLANADPVKNPKLVLANGAMSGGTAHIWADLSSTYWSTLLNTTLPNAGVSPNQIVAAWVEGIDAQPTGTYPADMQPTQVDLETVMQNLHTKFPNLKLAYLSGREYGGYGNGITPYDPEPYAYESSLAARGVIEDQLSGVTSLNWDPNVGAVMAPWLAWGPYYWANGLLARGDGLVYTCQDLRSDGLHPSNPAGRQKIASYMLNFFKTDTTTIPWFRSH
jgi:hypothetical protein